MDDRLTRAIAVAGPDERLLSLTWRDGSIRAARVADTDGTDPHATQEVLRALLASSGRSLQELTIGLWNHSGVTVLEEAGQLPSLHTLVIGDFNRYAYDCEMPISPAEDQWQIGDVSKIYAIAPNLTSLTVRGVRIELGELNHTKLRALKIHTLARGLLGVSARSISAANLPALTSLEIWFGIEDYDAESSVKDLSGLLAGEVCPQLRHLGLMNADIQDDLVEALAHSALLGRLESVDLSMGCMTDLGAQHLLDQPHRFRHLAELVVDDNFLSERMISELNNAFGDTVVAGTQKPEEELGSDIRYPTVSE